MTGPELTLRLLACSQALLIVATLALARVPGRAPAVILACGIAAYFAIPIASWQAVPPAVLLLAVGLSHGIPAALWFTIRAWLDDEEDLHSTALVIAAAYLALAMGGFLLAPSSDAFDMFTDTLPQLVKLGFVVAAIRVCWRDARGDLVELRRTWRRRIALGLAVLTAAVIVIELATGGSPPQWLESTAMALFFVVLLGFNAALTRTGTTSWLTPDSVRQLSAAVVNRNSESPPPGNEDLLVALEQTMSTDRAYADPELRIGTLAARLGVREYVLRRTINGALGERNFNRFVNRYRIEEASRRLRETARVPVLTIALDVGFRSLSAFNRAFREHHGMTPTAFRGVSMSKTEKS